MTDIRSSQGPPDFYQLLGVRPADDARVITMAYRRLARRYHPDIDPRPQALRRMIAINQAHAVLRDPDRRTAYDRELAVARAEARDLERDLARAEARDAEAAQRRSPEPIAIPIPPRPRTPTDGSVLPFGRYEGWTFERVAREDRSYLEWLQRTQVGRQFRNAIANALARQPVGAYGR